MQPAPGGRRHLAPHESPPGAAGTTTALNRAGAKAPKEDVCGPHSQAGADHNHPFNLTGEQTRLLFTMKLYVNTTTRNKHKQPYLIRYKACDAASAHLLQ